MAIMRSIPGAIARVIAAVKAIGALVGIGSARKDGQAPWMPENYQGGGTGVGVDSMGWKATKPKRHYVSKIEMRRRQKQSIRDRKRRYGTL